MGPAEITKGPFSMHGVPYTQNGLLVLIFVITFFRMLEEFHKSADFPFIAVYSVHLYTAKDADRNTTAEQKPDDKVQHSFLTSLSCGESLWRKSASVWLFPRKFGSVDSVSGRYPCSPKSIGSFIRTDPP